MILSNIVTLRSRPLIFNQDCQWLKKKQKQILNDFCFLVLSPYLQEMPLWRLIWLDKRKYTYFYIDLELGRIVSKKKKNKEWNYCKEEELLDGYFSQTIHYKFMLTSAILTTPSYCCIVCVIQQLSFQSVMLYLIHL